MEWLPHMFWIQSSLFGGVLPWVKLLHSLGDLNNCVGRCFATERLSILIT